MSETTRQHAPNELSEIYGKLNSQDVEQFYAGYQLWHLQQRAITLQAQIEDLRREIAANTEFMETVHPPAIALAAIARLQSSGVKDIDLLDRMLERGEEWLDRTMQRLDYCEQLEFIIDDYTQWCQNALEGAYDWIDSMREGGTSPSPEAATSETTSEATEELLLQKLTSEEDEPSSLLETVDSQAELPASEEPISALEESAVIIEESPIGVETPPDFQETTLESQEEQPSQSVESSPVSDSPIETASNISTEQADKEDAPSELSPTPDSQSSTGETSESQQLTSQVDTEFDPAPEEPPLQKENDSDFRQPPLQEHSKDIFADESSTYREGSQPYKMQSRDKQPDSKANRFENKEQSRSQSMMPKRRRNLLQRLAAKIWGR